MSAAQVGEYEQGLPFRGEFLAQAFLWMGRQMLARTGEGGFARPRGRCAVASPREPIREGTITGCRTGLMSPTGAA